MLVLIGLVSAVIVIGVVSRQQGDANAGRVWSAEHGHWHDAP
jgi:hypothetical protein